MVLGLVVVERDVLCFLFCDLLQDFGQQWVLFDFYELGVVCVCILFVDCILGYVRCDEVGIDYVGER